MPQSELLRGHSDAFAEMLGEGALVADGVGPGDVDDFVFGLDEGFWEVAGPNCAAVELEHGQSSSVAAV
jgi:hypothetical protein